MSSSDPSLAKKASTSASVVKGPPLDFSVKATVENPRGSEEKLFPKESVEGADTVLRGSVRAPEGFSEGFWPLVWPWMWPRVRF